MSATITAGYYRTRCSSADNIIDLRHYTLEYLVGTHSCPTFVHAALLTPLPLATFVRAPRLPSTLSTCVRTCCKTSLLPTAVLHSHLMRVCRHCRSLHSYALLVYQQHRSPVFILCRTSLVHTAVLHSYTLRVCRHCCWLHLYVLHVCRQHR